MHDENGAVVNTTETIVTATLLPTILLTVVLQILLVTQPVQTTTTSYNILHVLYLLGVPLSLELRIIRKPNLQIQYPAVVVLVLVAALAQWPPYYLAMDV